MAAARVPGSNQPHHSNRRQHQLRHVWTLLVHACGSPTGARSPFLRARPPPSLWLSAATPDTPAATGAAAAAYLQLSSAPWCLSVWVGEERWSWQAPSSWWGPC